MNVEDHLPFLADLDPGHLASLNAATGGREGADTTSSSTTAGRGAAVGAAAALVLERHSFVRLGELLPPLEHLGQTLLPLRKLSSRAQTVLTREGQRTWADLGLLSPAMMLQHWYSFGTGTALELVGVALESALDELTRSCGSGDGETAPVLSDDRRSGSSAGEAARTVALGAAADRILEECSSVTLGELLPRLEDLGERPLPLEKLSARTRAVLDRQGVRTWEGLARVAPATMLEQWYRVGSGTARELVGVALECAFDPGSPERSDPAGPAVASVAGALQTVAAWAAARGVVRSVPAALDSARSATLPVDVAQALQLLEGTQLEGFADGRTERYDVVALATELAQRLQDRRLEVFIARKLSPDPPTLEQLGRSMGVTRERARQVEAAGLRQIRELVAEARCEPLRVEVERLGSELGVAAPVAELPRHLPALSEPEDLAGRLLLWLAGPYHRDGDWLIRVDAEPLARRVQDVLRSASPEGHCDLETAERVMRGLGFDDRWRSWLEDRAEVRLVGERVLLWHGSMADRAELLLRLRGGPMEVQELADELGGVDDRSLVARLGSSRFTRVGRRSYGLRQWGGEAYAGVLETMRREIERAGGDADVSDLVQWFRRHRPEVAENSIRSYASSDIFVRTGRGRIRLRRAGDPVTTRRPLALTRACYVNGGRWSLRLLVNPQLLKGSGSTLPESFALRLGARPGMSTTLTTPHGQVHLGWSAQPTLGSIRPALEALGAGLGDHVLLTAGEAGLLEVRRLPETWLSGAAAAEQLALLVGEEEPGEDVVSTVAAATGLATDPVSSTAEVRRHLLERGDLDLVELIRALPS